MTAVGGFADSAVAVASFVQVSHPNSRIIDSSPTSVMQLQNQVSGTFGHVQDKRLPPGNFEVSALVKDPEVSNKTWTLSIDKHATVAEVIYSFLMRRNGDLNQACQLRLMFGGQVLSDDLDRTIEQCGVATRCLLHSMWRPSAGGCLNSATCDRCQKIAAAGQAASTPRKTLRAKAAVSSNSHSFNDEDEPANAKDGRHDDRTNQEANKKVVGGGKDSRKHGDTETEELKMRMKGAKRTPVASNATPVAPVAPLAPLAGLADGSYRGTVELIAHLEKLVAACGLASDIVGPLERLAKLHKHGALSDSEYSRAKNHVLLPRKE